MPFNVGSAIAYLDLDITAFNSSLQLAKSGINVFSGELTGVFGKLDSVVGKMQGLGSTLTGIGSQLTMGVTMPVVNFGSSCLDAYRDAESAFIGVRKTVDGTEEQFAQLEKEIMKLATSTASTYEEIAGVMEVAGQLGVPVDKIAEFSKVMIQLGDSTNLAADEAAGTLARFMNITGTTFDEVGNLGSAIVDLGNNFATDEQQIALMTTRLASAGTMTGLTTQEILALGTAMSSVGIRAEAGGTAMSTTLTQITKMIANLNSEDKEAASEAVGNLETIARVSGMTSEEFAAAWREKPIDALTAFIIGLDKAKGGNEEVVLTLDELGMTAVRQSNMLRSLAKASEMMTDAINVSNTAWEENTALATEAEQRYGSMDSRISQLNERWKEMKRDIAEILVPILEQLMDILEKVIAWWFSLSDGTKESIVNFLAFSAAVGPIVMVLGRLLSIGGSVIQMFIGLIAIIGKIGTAFFGTKTAIDATGTAVETVVKTGTSGASLFSKAWGGIKTLFTGLWSVVSAIGKAFFSGIIKLLGGISSIAAPLTGIASIIGGVALAVKSFFDMWNEGFSWAKEAVMLLGIALTAVGAIILGANAAVAAAVAAIVAGVATVVILVKDHIEDIKAAWSTFVNWLGSIWDWICDKWNAAWPKIKESVSKMVEGIKNAFNLAIEFIGKMWELVVMFWRESVQFVIDFVKTVVDLIKNLFEEVKQFVGRLWEGIVELWRQTWSAVTQFFKDIFASIKEFFGNVWNHIKEFFKNILQDFANFFNKIKEAFNKFKENGLKGIGQFILDIIKAVIQLGVDLIKHIAEFLGNIIKDVLKFGVDVLKHVGELLIKVVKAVIEFVPKMVSAAGDLIKGFIKGVVDWIPKAVQTVKDFAKRVLNGAKDILGINSPSKEFEKIGNYVDEGFANGVDGNSKNVVNSMVNVGDVAIQTMRKKMYDLVNETAFMLSQLMPVLNNVVNFFSNAANAIYSVFSSKMASMVDNLKGIFGNFLDFVNDKLNWLASHSGEITNVVTNMVNGSHRSGLDYVPFDGYVAKLHKGERVLTKEENVLYNNGNNGNGGDTFIFYDTKPDPYEYARQMKRVKRELQNA